jgi:DNA-binding NtrC family response regulator
MEEMHGFQQAVKTVLVVDEDPTNLAQLCEILNGQYNVLDAKDGAAAIALLKEFKGKIDLLLTNFSMAEMTGIESKMYNDREEMKVLLMSRFSAGMLVLNEGWHLMPKPFIDSQIRTLITGLIAPTPRYSVAVAPA